MSSAKAPTSSHGLAFCSRTLIPASPIAPRKPNGRQHASVENAATTAATGVAFSASFITPRPLLSKELVEAFPRMEPRSGLRIADKSIPAHLSAQQARHPRRQCESLENRETSKLSHLLPC